MQLRLVIMLTLIGVARAPGAVADFRNALLDARKACPSCATAVFAAERQPEGWRITGVTVVYFPLGGDSLNLKGIASLPHLEALKIVGSVAPGVLRNYLTTRS